MPRTQALHKDYLSLQKDLAEIVRDIQSKTQELRNVEQDIADKRAELQQLENNYRPNLSLLETQRDAAVKDIEYKQGIISGLNKEFAALNQQRTSLLEAIKQLELDLTAMREKYNAEYAEHTAKLNALNNQIEHKMHEVSRLEDAIKTKHGVFKEIEAQEQRLQELQQRVADYEEAAQHHQQTLQDLLAFEQSLKNKEKELNDKARDLAIIERRLKPDYKKFFKQYANGI